MLFFNVFFDYKTVKKPEKAFLTRFRAFYVFHRHSVGNTSNLRLSDHNKQKTAITQKKQQLLDEYWKYSEKVGTILRV